jgi:hypothetical protein
LADVGEAHEGDGQEVGDFDPTTLEDAGNVTSPTPAAADPFDPASLRLTNNYSNLSPKKAVLDVPFRPPAKEWFVRAHPSAAYRTDAGMLELREEGEQYLERSEEMTPNPGKTLGFLILSERS